MIGQKLIHFIGIILLLSSLSANAATRISPINYETHDDKVMRGFIMQNEKTAKDAPIAILIHGMQTNFFHWFASAGPMYGQQLSQSFLDKGYRVVALDARWHGYTRKEGSPDKAITKAKLGLTNDYYSMIQNSVKDYEYVLSRLLKTFKESKHIVAVGYSMGAQMAIMLAANNPEITHLITMVPPHTGKLKEVSPVEFSKKVKVQDWLLLMANEDDYNSSEENDEIEAAIASKYKRVNFESGHVLPQNYVDVVSDWVSKLN